MSAGVGYPYLAIDFGDGIGHVVPLEPGAGRDALQTIAREHVGVWRQPCALVLGPSDTIRFDANGGSLRVDEPPRFAAALVGRLEPAYRRAG